MNANQKKTVTVSLLAIILALAACVLMPQARFIWGFVVGAAYMMIVGVAKPVKKLADDAAVSPVIGVILMVAITVVLAMVVFVLVSNMGRVEQAPQISLYGDGNGNFTVQHADRGIAWSDLLFGPGISCAPTDDALAHPEVAAGDVVHCAADRLTIVHRPTNSVIYNH